MHPEGKIFLRPEYGRLGAGWPAIAFEKHAICRRLGEAYTRDARSFTAPRWSHDVVISTGTQNPELTPKVAYRGKILASAFIEPDHELATQDIVPAANWEQHCLYWGRPSKWSHSLPVLRLYHLAFKLPYPDAKTLIPSAYRSLSLRSGRPHGSAIVITDERERENLMRLPVKEVKLTLSPAVLAHQEARRNRIGKPR